MRQVRRIERYLCMARVSTMSWPIVVLSIAMMAMSMVMLVSTLVVVMTTVAMVTHVAFVFRFRRGRFAFVLQLALPRAMSAVVFAGG